MPYSCCVPRCSQKKISYHTFPTTNTGVRQRWIDSISVANHNLKINKNSRVCSYHFSESCFLLSSETERRILKPGSIPSIFDWDITVFHQPVKVLHNETLETELFNSTLMNGECDTGAESFPNETVNYQHAEATPNSIRDTSTQNCNCSILINEVNQLNKKCSEFKKKLTQLQNENEKLKASLKFQKTIAMSKIKQLSKEKIKSRSLEQKCRRLIPSLENLNGCDNDVRFYTGMPNYERLLALYEFLNPGSDCENITFWGSKQKCGQKSNKGRPKKLKPTEQFLLVMMRLRLGLFVKDLSNRFSVSTSVVSIVFTTWINLMYVKFGKLVIWPSRKFIDETMPEGFKKDYPSTRVIIDATEIKVQKPNSLVLQSGTYSTYKSCNTVKGLIGITPVGLVSFVSNLYTGCISDKELTRRSGLLKMQFNENDSIMADKGFIIEDMLKEIGVSLNIPPFLGKKEQFDYQDIEKTQKIAALRIHVERRIQRIRCYHIFDRPISISLGPIVNQIWTVCALLSNIQSPICGNNQSDTDNLNEIEPIIENV